MSISSYRRNVARGVTGKYSPACFPAALEKLSPANQLPPQTYRRYRGVMKQFDTAVGQERRQINPNYKQSISEIAWELGEIEFDKIEFERAETYRDFSRVVRALLRHDYR